LAARGTNDQRHFRGDVAVLKARARPIRKIQSALHPLRNVLAEIVAAHIGSDTDDGAPIFLSEKAKMLPDGILAWKKTSRGFGAENGHA